MSRAIGVPRQVIQPLHARVKDLTVQVKAMGFGLALPTVAARKALRAEAEELRNAGGRADFRLLSVPGKQSPQAEAAQALELQKLFRDGRAWDLRHGFRAPKSLGIRSKRPSSEPCRSKAMQGIKTSWGSSARWWSLAFGWPRSFSAAVFMMSSCFKAHVSSFLPLNSV